MSMTIAHSTSTSTQEQQMWWICGFGIPALDLKTKGLARSAGGGESLRGRRDVKPAGGAGEPGCLSGARTPP